MKAKISASAPEKIDPAAVPRSIPRNVSQQKRALSVASDALGQLQRRIHQSPRLTAQRAIAESIALQTTRYTGWSKEQAAPQGAFSLQRRLKDDEEPVQGTFTDFSLARSIVTAPNPRGSIQRWNNTTGMPDDVKAQMETALRSDFSDVRIHPSSSSASAVQALAYTQGNHIHFAPGQFKPNTESGKRLLGHELTHVLQQRAGRVRPTTEVGGLPVNDDPGLEQEADVRARAAANI